MGSGRSILIVEDVAEIREALAAVVRSEGFEVDVAVDGRDALEKLSVRVPWLILLDLMMPGMTGWEFREAQRRDPRTASVPVVVLSAVASESHRVALGAVACLRKPVRLDDLLAVLATWSVPS